MLDSYFKNGEASHHTPDMRDQSMVSADVHRHLQLLAQEAQKAAHEDEHSLLQKYDQNEKIQAKHELQELISDQGNESKKQELFAYISAHENLFTGSGERSPLHTDFFFHLVDHFPLTIVKYEMELAKQFPALELWIGKKTEQQKKKTKASIFSLFKKQNINDLITLPPATSGSVSFITRLAERIGIDDLIRYAQQVQADIQQIHALGMVPWGRIDNIDQESFDRVSIIRKFYMKGAILGGETLPTWKEIGDAMIANGEFTLGQRGDIAIGWFKLPGFARGFASSDFQRNENSNKHWTHNQDSLTPKFIMNGIPSSKLGGSYDVKYDAIQGNDSNERHPTIKKTLHDLTQQGFMYDHDDQFSQLIQRLMNMKGLSESDALSLFAYLTGQFGKYFVGPQTEEGRKIVGFWGNERNKFRYENEQYTGHASLILVVEPGERAQQLDQRKLAA